MKALQKTLSAVLPMMLVSVLCFVSCKPEEPSLKNWCKGEWVHNERWGTRNDTILNFMDRLTFSDKTFTFFHDTVGAFVEDSIEMDFFTPRSGITRSGTYRYEKNNAYLTYSDELENTYAASVYDGDYSLLNLHCSPMNSEWQLPAITTFRRLNPLPD